MALKISLKPDEKIIINQAIIVNGKHKTDFYLENHCAVLRTKDLLTEKEATSPSRVLYYLIQLHYLAADNLTERMDQITKLIGDIQNAAKSLTPLLEDVLLEIKNDNLYKALKNCDRLIQRESEILEHAS